eukprot:scaffold70636_cov51-Phaeocystis_antarctica.AAC.1
MDSMIMTLDVSKLSGWLNATACCRVEMKKRAYDAGRGAGLEAGEATGDRGNRQRAREGVRHGEERTENMAHMVVTLDVSKLSGWLNADARCRESPKGGHAVAAGREVRAGKRERQRATAPACSVQGRARPQDWGRGRARGRAHPEHAVHVCDVGGVEAQGLVERRRVLPRGKEGIGAGRGIRVGRRDAAGDRGACAACGGGRDCRLVAGARRGAHFEHVEHGCDAGGVEAQGLVERRRLPEHVRHGCDAGGVEAQGLVERRRAPEHARHGCDAGDVKAQWLIERRRALKHAVHVRDA